MDFGKYTLINGSFIPSDEFYISDSDSKALTFSERIRSVRTSMPFFNETLEIIKLKFDLLNQSFPEFTEKDGAGLKRQLQRTLTKNKHFLGAVLYLTFRFRNEKVTYSIQSEKLQETDFELNEKGLYVSIFDGIKKPVSAISNLSIGSELYWNIAKAQTGDNFSDPVLILNTENQIIEVPYSNIYTIKSNFVNTPTISSGSYTDITQPFIFEIFKNLNLKFTDEEPLTIQHIQESDEVFIANAIEGIRWIVGFDGKRYYNNTTRKINEEFNKGLVQ